MGFTEEFDKGYEEEARKTAREGNVIEGGFYRFQIHTPITQESVKEYENEWMDRAGTKRNWAYGHNYANLRLSLNAYTPKTKGKNREPWTPFDNPRTFWLEVVPDMIMDGNGAKIPQSKRFAEMLEAARRDGYTGPPKSLDVINWFVDHEAVVQVVKKETKDGDVRNYARGVFALSTQSEGM